MLRPGDDVCLLSYGPITRRAVELAERFEAVGCSAAVASVHTLKPLDEARIVSLLSRFEHVVVVEECAPHGGLAMQVKALAWEAGVRCRIDTFTLRDEFIHCYGSHDDLLAEHGLAVADIAGRLGLG